MQGGWLPRPVIAVARVAQPWLLQQTGITSIVIGANTREQLQHNPQVARLTLTSVELEILDSVIALPVEYSSRMETLRNQGRMVLPDQS